MGFRFFRIFFSGILALKNEMLTLKNVRFSIESRDFGLSIF